jgi:glutathionylspermidine synthase
VRLYYPNALQIVDWFHAEEHLEGVAAAAFPTAEQRSDWLEPVTQALWEGQVEAVIRACQALASTCLKARQAVAYFSNNIDRMRYDRFRAAGYMIGSGTIESACKQLVTHRLDLPGAQWEVDGAVHTAKARAVWLSGLWQVLCQRRAALPLAV